MAHFVAGVKRNYIFGGICSIAANASMKVCMFLTNLGQILKFYFYLPLLIFQIVVLIEINFVVAPIMFLDH